ncbi:uncharacterized protein EHS24_000902 [Apiotrichum porosum]|uniref:Uncharacterized protein n=1 Tax=Apiotrichum porosum TaxID=105984 RepID=A0A427YB91_9TREE|nr:uncharacterized protein EHS24_000902 [Apiotrichum porosum]RSH88363.1 hypothetical protein EHS24_000902 [Apiotrichum porosum]
MKLSLLLVLAPFALGALVEERGGGGGGGGGGGATCSTATVWKTNTVTSTKNLPPYTTTVSKPSSCVYRTTTLVNAPTTIPVLVYTTTTLKPITVTITPSVIKTVTKTTSTVTAACTPTHKYKKRQEVPEEMTNAERLRRHLPLKAPAVKRGGSPPTNPSCTPKTVTSTAIVTNTNEACSTSTATSYYCTKTSVYTSICYTTVKSTSTAVSTKPAQTVTSTAACAPTTTTTTVYAPPCTVTPACK